MLPERAGLLRRRSCPAGAPIPAPSASGSPLVVSSSSSAQPLTALVDSPAPRRVRSPRASHLRVLRVRSCRPTARPLRRSRSFVDSRVTRAVRLGPQPATSPAQPLYPGYATPAPCGVTDRGQSHRQGGGAAASSPLSGWPPGSEKIRAYNIDLASGQPLPGAQMYSAREMNTEGTHAIMIRASDNARTNVKLDTATAKISVAVSTAFQSHDVRSVPLP